MNKQRGNILIITIILVVIALGALGYFFYQNLVVNKQTATNQSTQVESKSESPTTISTKKFTSKEHFVSFSYPENWAVTEEIDSSNNDNWYASTITIKNEKNNTVAIMGTGGQFGGTCSEDAPFYNTSTILKDSVSPSGVEAKYFAYTIVETDSRHFSVVFGLGNSDTEIQLGDNAVQCPGLSINYKYIARSTSDTAVGGITFGSWYLGSNDTDHVFASKAEAQSYLQSDEFKSVEAMIKSLSIGN